MGWKGSEEESLYCASGGVGQAYVHKMSIQKLVNGGL